MSPPRKQPKPARAQYAQSLDALAQALGLDPRTVKRWKIVPGFPAKEPEGYPVEKVRRFIERNRKDNAHREVSPEEKEEKAKLVRARRMLVELKLEQERGALVPAATAAELVGAIYGKQRALLERMIDTEPAKIAKLGTVEAVREHLRAMANDLLAGSRAFVESLKKEHENERN